MTLPRGFKSAAERQALDLRTALGLSATDGLDMRALAQHLGVKVVSADILVERSRLEELERIQAFAFSAVTFEIRDNHYIVTNPLRLEGRISSDIAHEISHLLLKHRLSEISEIDGVPFRTCQPEEEEQATALGGTLLLPRPLLIKAARQNLRPEEIAAKYSVTTEMARFRLNSTGVLKQLGARSKNLA